MVDALVRGVVNKLLRPPILHLKDAAATGNGYHEVEHVRAIFHLNEGEAAAPSDEETGGAP